MEVHIRASHVGKYLLTTNIRDRLACETKWHHLLLEYKKISNYFNWIGRKIMDYSDLSIVEKIKENLPQQFNRNFFDAIHNWFENRPRFTLLKSETYYFLIMPITRCLSVETMETKTYKTTMTLKLSPKTTWLAMIRTRLIVT